MELFIAELGCKGLELGIALGRIDELQDGHLKVGRKADKTVERNAVLAVFIFLHLLKGHVEKLSDVDLALARSAAGGSDITSKIP